MTVKELKEILQDMPDDLSVYIEQYDAFCDIMENSLVTVCICGNRVILDSVYGKEQK